MSQIFDYSPIGVYDPANTLVAFGYQQVRFLGSVTVVQLGGQTQVTVGGGASVAVQQSGVPILSSGTLNFIGATVVDNGGTADITVTGAPPTGNPFSVGYFDSLGNLASEAQFLYDDVSRQLNIGSGNTGANALALTIGSSIDLTFATGIRTIVLGNSINASGSNIGSSVVVGNSLTILDTISRSIVGGSGLSHTIGAIISSVVVTAGSAVAANVTASIITGTSQGITGVITNAAIFGNSHDIAASCSGSLVAGYDINTSGFGTLNFGTLLVGTAINVTAGLNACAMLGSDLRASFSYPTGSCVVGILNDDTNAASHRFVVGNGAGITRSNAFVVDTSGNATINRQLKIVEGANKAMGVATLVAGTVVVNTTVVTANSRIFLTGQNSSGTHGELTISARTAATSFTITSSNAADTRDIAWLIVEPG